MKRKAILVMTKLKFLLFLDFTSTQNVRPKSHEQRIQYGYHTLKTEISIKNCTFMSTKIHRPEIF